MTTITAFKCGFCPAIQQHLRNAKAHEERCARNPASRACLTCRHHGTDWTDGGWENAPTVEFFTCAAPEEAKTEPAYDLRHCHAWEPKGETN